MTAVIYIDTRAIHPVVDGVWHRTRLTSIPEPGQGITMLCGVTASAAFESLARRRDHGVPKTCFDCEAEDMRDRGIPVPTSHPSLRPRPTSRRADR